ncbi:MAG: VIT domain-containing protein [Pseudomonadota bacterium]
MDEKFGVLTEKNAALPLLGVRVSGEITGRSARVRMAQRYRNTEKTPLEVVYRFPLPEQAAVCGFRALVGESIFEGVVEEREEAFRHYDKALEKGYGAYLLDEERPNIFTISLGNLLAGAEVVVEISWLMRLDTEKDRYRFCLPTTIAPRYLPSDTPDKNGVPVSEQVMPPYAWQVDYGLSLSLNVTGLPAAALIESPSHPLKVALAKDGETTVSLGCECERLDRDFILYLGCEPETSSAWRETDAENAYYQTDICLPVEDKQSPPEEHEKREFIFLLDCSGSMQGDSISHARRALEVCLKALEEGWRFNVYRFGSTFEKMFDQPVEYTEKALSDALQSLENWTADLGGTELFAPLEAICAVEPDSGWKREILVITDGEIGNEEQVRKLVQNRRCSGRFSVLGIGAAANDHLVATLSRAGQGFHGYVFPGENIERKTVELFSRLGAEMISDVKVSWPGENNQSTPNEPLVFPGRPTSIFCRAPLDEKPPASLVVSFRRGDALESITVPIKEAGTDGPIRLFWAREAIRDLEEGVHSTGSLRQERQEQSLRSEIIALSRQYGLMSAHTSMVSVEKRADEDRAAGPAQLRRVPVLVAAGWHGFPSFGMREPSYEHCFESAVSARMRKPVCKLATKKMCTTAKKIRMPIVKKSCHTLTKPLPVKDNLVALLAVQRMEGGFNLDAKLAARFKLKFNEIQAAGGRLENAGEEDVFFLVSTALVLAFLERFFADSADVWKPVTRKSRRWLDHIIKRLNPKIDGQPLMEWAHKYVSSNATHNPGR